MSCLKCQSVLPSPRLSVFWMFIYGARRIRTDRKVPTIRPFYLTKKALKIKELHSSNSWLAHLSALLSNGILAISGFRLIKYSFYFQFSCISFFSMLILQIFLKKKGFQRISQKALRFPELSIFMSPPSSTFIKSFIQASALNFIYARLHKFCCLNLLQLLLLV